MMRIIKTLKKLLKPMVFVAATCLIMAPVIYFFGNKIGARGIYPFKDLEVRFWVAISLIILASILLLIMLVKFVRARMAARVTEEKREPTQEELEVTAMDKVFERAVAVIRNRWSGTGRRIYGLPWFLVIGRVGAGKTSIIENGDMRFPIDHEISAELADIGDYDAVTFANWRIAGNEAVLLDMAGENFVAHENRTSVQKVLWNSFLNNLQKIRPRRPINGIILAIDLVEFSGFSMAQREEYSSLVRRTINDLVERLGTRLTVYIMFSKLDQMAGFVDFFENISATDREKLFGFHFLYEGNTTPGWIDQFETQYTEFLDRLHKQIKRRFLDIKGTRTRQEAFTFYRMFLGLQAPLTAFLNSALTPDKFSTPPLVRGVYFVSNRQENAPRNVFLEAVGQRYHLPVPLYGTNQGSNYPFFVTPFFKKAVFSEAGLAGNNLKVERRYRRRALAAVIASVLLIVGGGVYWKSKYDENLQLAENVLEKTRAFSKLDVEQRQDPTGRQLLDPLSTIRGATFEFGDYRDISPVKRQLTLYQGQRIGPIADTAYRTVLNEQFAPALVGGVEENLRSVCPKGSDEELEYLRVYRMLGDTDGRDDRVVSRYFRNFWQTNFEAEGEIQDQLNGHLDYMLRVVPKNYELDENLVIASQNNLGSLTPYRRVYATLRSDAERQLPNPIEFRSSIGANFNLVFEANTVGETAKNDVVANSEDGVCGSVLEKVFERKPFQVPRLFTAKEFVDFFVPQNMQVAKVAARDLWVLGKLETTQYSEADYATIRNKVREIYTDEYIRIWRQTLNTMKVRDFHDIRDATSILRALSGSDNPIKRIAQLVTDNTIIYELTGEIIDGSEAVDAQLPIDPNRAAGLQIYESFGEIRRMLEVKPEGGQQNIEQIQEALISLYDYLKSIRDAPQPNAKALELALQRAKLTGEDPIFVLKRIAERAPAPFNDHLRHVADEAWRIVMIGATEELNRKWHDEIYGDYQRLIAGKYPFNRNSEIDLPIEDFEEFFKPEGILESFYQKELLIFVDETTGKPRTIDGQSLAVDPGFAQNLRKAIEITKSFFNASGDLSVEFKVQSVGMNANLARAVLNFEGQVVVSSHGPSRPITMIWPNIIDQPASSRIDLAPLHGAGKPFGRQFDGSWSWLRLYDSASKTNLQNNSVDISFGNANGQSAKFRIRPEARVNPFFNSPLSQFSLPSHLRSKGIRDEI